MTLPVRLTQDDFAERARSIHGDKYDYSRVVYVNKETKVDIICPEHGIFQQTPANHWKNKGCPKCAKNCKLTQDDFIRKAKDVHGDRYDYSKTQFTLTREKVIITCREHGDFEQEANSHLRGVGCPVCGDKLKSLSEESYKLRSEHMKATCLQRYGVTNVMQNVVFQRKNDDTKRRNGTFNTSRPEEIFYLKLCEVFGFDDVVRQYSSDVYPFRCDFYVLSRNMYIELNIMWTHGGHWYNDVCDIETMLQWKDKALTHEYYEKALFVWTVRDVFKRKAALDNKLNYVVFWKQDLSDANAWFSQSCPDAQDWLYEYSWMI